MPMRNGTCERCESHRQPAKSSGDGGSGAAAGGTGLLAGLPTRQQLIWFPATTAATTTAASSTLIRVTGGMPGLGDLFLADSPRPLPISTRILSASCRVPTCRGGARKSTLLAWSDEVLQSITSLTQNTSTVDLQGFTDWMRQISAYLSEETFDAAMEEFSTVGRVAPGLRPAASSRRWTMPAPAPTRRQPSRTSVRTQEPCSRVADRRRPPTRPVPRRPGRPDGCDGVHSSWSHLAVGPARSRRLGTTEAEREDLAGRACGNCRRASEHKHTRPRPGASYRESAQPRACSILTATNI